MAVISILPQVGYDVEFIHLLTAVRVVSCIAEDVQDTIVMEVQLFYQKTDHVGVLYHFLSKDLVNFGDFGYCVYDALTVGTVLQLVLKHRDEILNVGNRKVHLQLI